MSEVKEKNIYQVGAFNHYEGDQEPNIMLEHEKEFSDKEIQDMIEYCVEHIPDKNHDSSQRFIANMMQEQYGFKIIKTRFINVWDYMGF